MRTIEPLVDPEEDSDDEIESLPAGPSPASLTINSKRSKKLVTVADAEDAARRVGLKPVSFAAIKGHTTLGEYITQQGAIPLGRSMLLLAFQHLQGGLEFCNKLLAEEISSNEAVELLKALGTLAKAQVESANSLIKSAATSDAILPQSMPVMPAFGPGQVVVPIQINNATMPAQATPNKVDAPA